MTNITSPCTRNCCLDLEDICLGCFRHITEICGWNLYTHVEKLDVLEATEKRKANAYIANNNKDSQKLT